MSEDREAVELAALAIECLDAGQKYFRTRTPHDLTAAKNLEKRLRERSARVLSGRNGKGKPVQGTLFGNDSQLPD